jgi:Tol biopolymer transport system component
MGVLAAAPVGADTGLGGGGVIAFSSARDGDGDIWTVHPDGTELTNLTDTDTNEIHPFWSPDGSQLVFVSYRTGSSDIFVMNADGTAPTQLTDNAADDWGPAWSPDGSTIAFVSDRTGQYQIWLIDFNGDNPRQLTTFGAGIGAGAYWPAWSPDSSQLVLTSSYDLFVVDVATGDTTNLTNDGPNQKDTAPAWSPDGSTIVWQSLDRGTPGWGGWDLWSMQIGAPPSEWQQLTVTTNLDEEVPAFSPDGQWVVYDINESTVWISRSDGTEATQITDSLGNRDAAWQPLGSDEPEPEPSFWASLTNDWVDASGFTPNGSVTIEIYASEGGDRLFGEPRVADDTGHYFMGGEEHEFDLVPGMFLTVTDDGADPSVVKDLTLEPLTLDLVDYDNDVVTGTAPNVEMVNVSAGNDSGHCGFDVAVTDGMWSADFAVGGPGDCPDVPFNITEEHGFSAQLFDEDGDATVAEPTESEPEPEPGINGAGMNIHNSVTGPDTDGYGFELFIQAYGEFGGITADKVTITVNETELELEDRIDFYPTDDGRWDFSVGAGYPGTPNLGQYHVEVIDYGGAPWGFEIGTLEDIPEGAPDMVFPTHLSLTTDTMPTISWDSFTSDYQDTTVAPWAYELNFAPSGNEDEASFVFPINPGTTSIPYDDPLWEGEPLPLEGLEPGVYNVTVHSNHDVAPGFNFEHHRNLQFVLYDPDGGFVTGGGWIDSPEGAYAPDPELSGRATFGFVSKYKKGASVPTGGTEFQFRVADLNFHSDSYEWLVVAGPNAKYKGAGTINGSGEYGFMLTACDVAVTGNCQGNSADTFRIKIWDNNGDVVYDNKMGASDGSKAGTVLGGGNIKVHKK